MARMCDICKKGPNMGGQTVRRGKSKKEGGIGLNVTGMNKRRFLPNLRSLHVKNKKGSALTIKLCIRCLRGEHTLHKAGYTVA